MLPPDYLEKVETQAINIYNDLELEIIKEISERIANVGYANTVVKNDILIAQEMGMLYSDVIDLVSKYNKTSYEEIEKIFEKAGITTIKNDDEIYKEAGLNPISIKQDKAMMDLLISSANKTNNNLTNLTMTTATTSQSEFLNAMNRAYMEVSTGVKSYSQAIIDAVDNIGSKGAVVTYPSGHQMSLESAARMNVVTGVNQTCGKMQLLRAEELNWDLMEITAHGGARPEHAVWQGKIVSRSGKKGYLSFKDIGYGEVTGFKGINCKHDWNPYFEGSSKTYSEKQLKEWQNETIKYKDKSMTRYEANQVQRNMERTIRQDKRDLAGIQGILTSNTTDSQLIEKTKTDFARKTLYYNSHVKELAEFTDAIESRNDITKVYIGKQEKTIKSQMKSVTQIATKYNKEIIGIKVQDTEIKEVSEHIISRTFARSLDFEDVQDTLNNPLDYGKIKIDEQGRKSINVYGKKVTVSVNPDTGKLTTARPTNKRELKKYESKE